MATKYAGQNALNKLMQLVKTALNNKADKTNATTSAAGLMSAADKVKLDGVEAGANKTVVDSALSASSANPVQNKAVKTALDGLQDKMEDYYVTFTHQKDSSGEYSDEYTANHTAKEIYEAYQAGKRVWRKDIYERFPITACTLLSTGEYIAYFTHFEPGNMMVCYGVNQKSDTAASTASKLVYGIIAPNPGSADNGKYLTVNGSKIAYTDLPDGITVDSAMSASSTNPVQNKVIKKYVDDHAADDAVLYTAQTLTYEQKFQARKNIGALSSELPVTTGPVSLCPANVTDNNDAVHLTTTKYSGDDFTLTLDCGPENALVRVKGIRTPTDAETNAAATVEYVKAKVASGGVTVDTAMSSTSTNPVQNKVVKSYVDTKVSGLQTASQVQDAINSAITGVYTPKGSIAFASLPTAAAGNKGWVYNVSDAFTTTAAFVEGAGHSYGAGTNVVCVDAGSGSYKWDVLAGTIDLTELTADEVQTLWNSI